VRTAQRVSRGFHRLAVFLATIPLLLGAIASLYIASETANSARRSHDEQATMICAQNALYKKFYADLSREEFERRVAEKLPRLEAGEDKVTDPDLKELGCSVFSRKVSLLEIFRAKAPGEFDWKAEFLLACAAGIAVTLVLVFTVYSIVRAIGWVIGGFAA
jgi:hypothetical protein